MIALTLARKPFPGSASRNVATHGTGGLNINACRIGTFQNSTPSGANRFNAALARQGYRPDAYQQPEKAPEGPAGRWPPNMLLTHHEGCTATECTPECAVHDLGVQSGTSSSRASGYDWSDSNNDNPTHIARNIKSGIHFGDSGTAARYFPQFHPERS